MNLKVDSFDCTIDVLDTAGQPEYQSMLDSWITFAEVFILVFAIDDKDSFEYVKQIYKKVVNHKKDQPPIVVFGNKSDISKCRVVSKDEAEAFCNERGIEYFETSASAKSNVKEGFMRIISLRIQSSIKSRSKKNQLADLENNQIITTSTDTEEDIHDTKSCFCF